VVILTALETTSELLPFIASRIAEILLVGVLFGLFEELLEFSSHPLQRPLEQGLNLS